jgi:hypothetical protein
MRQRHGDDHRGDPVGECDPDKHGERDHRRQHQARQVAGEVGIQPLGREGRDLLALLAA